VGSPDARVIIAHCSRGAKELPERICWSFSRRQADAAKIDLA